MFWTIGPISRIQKNTSPKKAYLQIIGINNASPIFKWMWKFCVRGKHKFFFWLLLGDKLNTIELLRRKNMDLQEYNCVLCTNNARVSFTFSSNAHLVNGAGGL
jgi:hypothetical protein